jgi:predicted Zn-dependent protease
MRRSLRIIPLPLIIAAVIIFFQFMRSEKYTNPETGERHRVALSTQDEATLGLQSYREILSNSRVVTSGPEYELVRRVAQRLVGGMGESSREFEWQVSVIESPQANAFCLPGGKIAVYTGIIPIAGSEAGLAAVMGHEIAHATSRHGAQRLFQSSILQTALAGAQWSMGEMSPQQRTTIMALLGAGAQYGVLLPFSREHETEADQIGLLYMARAGYDPRESIGFWERMAEAGGGNQPPEFASTHPSHGTRVETLKAFMPKAMEEYQKAQSAQGP